MSNLLYIIFFLGLHSWEHEYCKIMNKYEYLVIIIVNMEVIRNAVGM
jgi:hypothetical protein